MKYFTAILITFIFSASLIVTGYFIKGGLIKIKSSDRFVTVKGLAEQDVRADLAIWSIQFKVADNELAAAQAELKRQSNIINNFLISHGLNKDEISVSNVMINDAFAQQYQQNNIAARYAIDKTILVRTTNIDAIETAAQKLGDLIAEGVIVGYGSLPQYSYTKLNEIKPEMIAAATLNAREAAEQFANDSGASVGAIRSATQGYFSIMARDDIAGLPDTASINKRVRVVSTVDYYLHD